jgi:hypothetical protein
LLKSNLPAIYNWKVVIKAPGEDKGRKQIISLMMNGKPVTMPFTEHTGLVPCRERVFGRLGKPTDL